MVAEQHNAVFYAHFLDENYRTGREKTEFKGDDGIRKYISPLLLWELLPDKHPDKEMCIQRNVTFTKRIYDIKHPDRTKMLFNTDIADFMNPDQNDHNCLVILGFYRNLYPCKDTIVSMWAAIESEIEIAKGTKSLHRKTQDQKKAQKQRNLYVAYKNMATSGTKFQSKLPIKLQRTKPAPQNLISLKKKYSFDSNSRVERIIGDTTYNRDNNPDLLLKRLRYKSLMKKEGKKGGLFLNGMDVT